MRILFTVVVFLLFANNALVASETNQTVKFEVAKMTCATCPIAVKKAMQRVNGVIDVSVSYDDKVAIVTYDSALTTPKKIGQASTDVGFPATLKTGK
ncbi:MAG: cation transporter [Pseudomonadota bacterium]